MMPLNDSRLPTLDQRLAARESPSGKPVMFQRWEELLFLHWAWDPQVLQAVLPPGLTIDTWDNRGWVGVVPFFMRNIRPVWSPVVPGVSHFLELNLRTYVFDAEGRPGVWFFSLEANQALAVILARRFFSLPYQHARMQASSADGEVRYRSQRCGVASHSEFRYQGEGASRLAEPGSFEFFLVERYLLFSWQEKRRQLFSGQVVHPPYVIRDAGVAKGETDLFGLNDLDAPAGPPDHQLYSGGVDVEVFGLRPCRSAP
jgi:uncharacterized protein